MSLFYLREISIMLKNFEINPKKIFGAMQSDIDKGMQL